MTLQFLHVLPSILIVSLAVDSGIKFVIFGGSILKLSSFFFPFSFEFP
jgi:hypothetical protein